MISPIFNNPNAQYMPKQLENWERYCKVIQWGRQNPTRFVEEFINLRLTDFQKYVFLSTWNTRFSVILCSRNTGKATTLDTVVYKMKEVKDERAKSEGGTGETRRFIVKTTIGELEEGDMIVGSDGKLTKVIQLHPIVFDEVYEVEFEDGEIVECNGDHLWAVIESCSKKALVITAKEMYDVGCLNRYCFGKDKIGYAVPCGIKSDRSNGGVFRGEERVGEVNGADGKYKNIVCVTKTNKKKSMRCITVDAEDGCFVCGEHHTTTHNSFFSSPYIMAKSLLFPDHKTYIMSVTGGQATETALKLKALATGKIASVAGVSSVFIENCMAANAHVSPFTSGKDGVHVELFNGSEITSIASVPDNARGKRSNLNVYDEAAFIPQELIDATIPFTTQSGDFMTGKSLNNELMPPQMPNQNLFLSSASDISSDMYRRYKEGYQKMLLGDPDYFVCDLDYNFSLHPYLDGKEMPALISKEIIENAYKINPYAAEREFGNIWSDQSGPDCFVKRTTLEKCSIAMWPIFENEDGAKKYLIAYDPSSKVDNSIVGVAELFRDPEKGLMLKLVNMKNMLEVNNAGEKMVKQQPEQIQILKQMILSYNRGACDYDNLDLIQIDAGAGGRIESAATRINNALNCWEVLKMYILQRNFEIKIGANVEKYIFG